VREVQLHLAVDVPVRGDSEESKVADRSDDGPAAVDQVEFDGGGKVGSGGVGGIAIADGGGSAVAVQGGAEAGADLVDLGVGGEGDRAGGDVGHCGLPFLGVSGV